MEKESAKNLQIEINRLREDLSKKEQEIEKLKVSGLFWETIFNGIPEEIIVIDENHIIQDVNRIFLENYGLEKKDVIGKKCYKLIYQADKPCSLDSQLCPLEKAKQERKRVEITHYNKKGIHKGKEMVRIMYPLPAKGEKAEYFVEIAQDITEYRNLIRRVKASEEKFRAILDTVTDAIISIDENQKIVVFNNAAERIFGYSSDEILGKDLNLLIPPEYGDHSRFVKRFLKTREPKIIGDTLSLTAMKKNKEEFPIKLGLSYNETKGGITFTAIIRDVSTQKKLENKLLQTERLAAVGQTVAHVAHEIRNPLMIIGGFSHQIRKTLTDEKSIKKLSMIFDEVRRLENLVANLGDFTKEYRLVKRQVDINSVIRDVLKIVAEIHSSKKYTFDLDLASDLEEINCDPDKLKQVFLNIIANGMEAMHDGGRIRVSTEQWHSGVELRISDNGIGINEDDLFHIFEPFYTTRESGSGLGLSISYKIVEAHKGEIFAISLPGEGTTFVIRIP
ncbi:MAG: PAS domain S-box protein [Desulfobacterales bacterium]|nr:PAS domain S-box protein [Desulfobacterales bacterium]